MEIVLMGYMGSGKSTIGNRISNNFNLAFIDLDSYIEEQEQLSVSEIFEQKGEIYFRLKEALYLEEILKSKSNYVLSLGGGTPCYGKNMTLIKESTAVSCYLRASIPTLVSRLAEAKEQRPLLAALNYEQLLEYVGKHVFERATFYEQAMYKIDVNGSTIAAVVAALSLKLNKH